MLTVCKQLHVFTREVVLKMMPNADVPFQAEIKGKEETVTIFLFSTFSSETKTNNRKERKKKRGEKNPRTNKISPSSGVSFATRCGPGVEHSGICSHLLRCAVNEHDAALC